MNCRSPGLSFTPNEIPIGNSAGEWGFNLEDRVFYYRDENTTLFKFEMTSDLEKTTIGPIAEALTSIASGGGNPGDSTAIGNVNTDFNSYFKGKLT